MGLTEEELLNEQQQLMQVGKLSRQQLYRLNEVQAELRNRYDYKYSDAPKIVRDGGDIVAKPGIGGFDVGTRAEQREASAKRREERREEKAAESRLESGEGTAKDVLGPNEVSLTQGNQEALRQRAEANAANRAAKVAYEAAVIAQKRKEEAQILFSGVRPVASAIGEQTVYAQVGTQELFTGETTEIGSNIKQTAFVPFGKSVVSLPKPSKPELPPVAGFKAAVTAYKNYERGIKSKIYVSTDNVNLGSRGVVSYDRLRSSSQRPDVQLAVSVGSMFNKYGAVQKRVVQESAAGVVLIGSAIKLSEASWAYAAKKTAGTPWASTIVKVGADTLKPFAESSIKDPVLTYAAVRGPMLLGRRAYKALDYFDVGQSVVGGAVTGYTTTGNVGGAALGAGTGLFMEKASDVVAGSFTSTGPKTTFKVSPTLNTGEKQSKRFKGIIYQTAADIPKGTKVDYSFLKADPLPKKPTNGLKVTTDIKMGSVTNKVRFKTTRFVNTMQGPRRVEVLQETVIRTPTSKPRTRTISQTMMPRTVSDMFRSKAGSLSLTGSMSTTSPDYQGGLTNFQGTSDTFRPSFPSTSQQTPKARPVSRPKSRPVARQMARPLSVQMTPSKTNFFGKNRFTYNAQSQFNTQSVSFNPTRTQTQTFSINPTQSITMSPTISQTTTVSPTRTLTFTQTPTRTQTVTPTLSPTVTQTPTITPTFGKLPKFKTSSFASGFNTKKTGIKTKYTATAFAAGFNIKGKKLKGKLTGLEFRGV